MSAVKQKRSEEDDGAKSGGEVSDGRPDLNEVQTNDSSQKCDTENQILGGADSGEQLLELVEQVMHPRKGLIDEQESPKGEEKDKADSSTEATEPNATVAKNQPSLRQLSLRPAPMLGINRPIVEVLEDESGFSVVSPDNSFTIKGDSPIIRRLKRILFI